MSTSVRLPRRCIAVLKLPEDNVPLFLVRARQIVASMSANAWFSSPSPSLATVEGAIKALSAAQAAKLSRTQGTTEVRDQKHLDLKKLLDHLCMYVQSIADAHPESAASIIESAGMYVKGARAPGRLGFRVKNGLHTGELQAFTDKAGDRASYEWAYSVDGRATWIPLPVTNEARTTITGLTPGTCIWVRVRATLKSVTGDWSDPLSIIVT